MNWKSFVFLIALGGLLSCNEQAKKEEKPTQEISIEENKGKALILETLEKTGTYRQLREKKDVVYTYVYTTPDGKTDSSTEKYIFKDELSYGMYTKHERTFPQLEGSIEQSFDGTNYWLRHQGKVLNDTTMLKRVAFNRPTNFYWFAMFQKLTDPGLTYEYLGTTPFEEKQYEVVKVSFESDAKPKDIYQLYINTKSGLIDHFLFTVAEFNVVETPLLMKVEYEEIDGLLIPSKRKYKRSNWELETADGPWIEVNWTDIRFNNGLQPKDFNFGA